MMRAVKRARLAVFAGDGVGVGGAEIKVGIFFAGGTAVRVEEADNRVHGVKGKRVFAGGAGLRVDVGPFGLRAVFGGRGRGRGFQAWPRAPPWGTLRVLRKFQALRMLPVRRRLPAPRRRRDRPAAFRPRAFPSRRASAVPRAARPMRADRMQAARRAARSLRISSLSFVCLASSQNAPPFPKG